MMPLLLTLVLAATAVNVQEMPEVHLADRYIRVGDLATMPGKEQIVLASVANGRSEIVIDAEQARLLLRNRFPLAQPRLRHAIGVRLVTPMARTNRHGVCRIARASIEEGEVITQDNTSRVDCTGDPAVTALGYDHERRVPYARGLIEPGNYLGAVRPATTPIVVQGEQLLFRTFEGPVVVERKVEALQVGKFGRHMFVRTEDEMVISARLVEDREEAQPR